MPYFSLFLSAYNYRPAKLLKKQKATSYAFAIDMEDRSYSESNREKKYKRAKIISIENRR